MATRRRRTTRPPGAAGHRADLRPRRRRVSRTTWRWVGSASAWTPVRGPSTSWKTSKSPGCELQPALCPRRRGFMRWAPVLLGRLRGSLKPAAWRSLRHDGRRLNAGRVCRATPRPWFRLDGDDRLLVQQRGRRRPGRQAAQVVAPGVDRDPVVGFEQLDRRPQQRLEHLVVVERHELEIFRREHRSGRASRPPRR